LASFSSDQGVKIWDARNSVEARRFTAHQGLAVWSVAFSADGSCLATAGFDKAVRIWDAETCQEIRTLRGHAGFTRGVAFSPDGTRLASCSDDRTVRVWDTTSGRCLLTLTGHNDAVSGVAWNADGSRLASWSPQNKTAKVWDVATGELLRGYEGCWKLAFSPQQNWLACAGDDRTVKVWDIANDRLVQSLETDAYEIAFSPDGTQIVTVRPQHLQLWDLTKREVRWSSKAFIGTDIESVSFSPDGNRLAIALGDSTARILDTQTGEEILTLRRHRDVVCGVSFSREGTRLATASFDGTVTIWEAGALSPETRLDRHAITVIDNLFAEAVLKDEVIAKLRENRTISEPVRQKALSWIKRYREDKFRLNELSWNVVRAPECSAQQYRQALRWIEAACRDDPDDGELLNTLGVAQYRLGHYGDALATLSRSDQFNKDHPQDLAFLAMTHYRLGHKEQAQVALARLRETLKKPETAFWAFNEEVQASLKEAETLIDAQAGKAKR
jgi:WD domain, G-beta repeat/Tetratricopeptide repeat/Anaphase-promoting complex subunit 4 WD40 domain